MKFRVSRQYLRGAESDIAEFVDEIDAKQFVCEKSEKDHQLKVNTVYRLYQGAVLLETFNSSEVESGGSAGGGKGSSYSSAPTPFSTNLNPGGMPKSWRDDKKTEDE